MMLDTHVNTCVPYTEETRVIIIHDYCESSWSPVYHLSRFVMKMTLARALAAAITSNG